MKILFGYPYYPSAKTYGNVEALQLEYFKRLRNHGYEVEGFCLTIAPPHEALTFKELDLRWKRGDKKLFGLYEQLEEAIIGKDVLFNGPGINLHPRFVEQLPIYTVFGCNDDPENSHNLSRPAAAAYDLCLIGNIAEVETYKSWGVRNVEWYPLGLQPQIYDASLTYDRILDQDRDIDLFMMIDKYSPPRVDRMERMDAAFPKAHFYGKGWQRGYLPAFNQLKYLARAKIGPNFHNSTGPINFRTFYLPANGVMQICDNKSHLGKIYELDKEVVGFDTVDECIDLCRYYLVHDKERRQIAANGWKRAVTEYSEINAFKKYFMETVEKYFYKKATTRQSKIVIEIISKEKLSHTLFFFLYIAILIPINIFKRLPRKTIALLPKDMSAKIKQFFKEYIDISDNHPRC
jgi:spore maturation protein CgeB